MRQALQNFLNINMDIDFLELLALRALRSLK